MLRPIVPVPVFDQHLRAHSLSRSPPQAPKRGRDDGVRADPLFTSSARRDSAAANKTKGTAAEIPHPHATQSRRRGRRHPPRARCVMRVTQLDAVADW
jgi:hypothetical protein